jgi:hypothetical protein
MSLLGPSIVTAGRTAAPACEVNAAATSSSAAARGATARHLTLRHARAAVRSVVSRSRWLRGVSQSLCIRAVTRVVLATTGRSDGD